MTVTINEVLAQFQDRQIDGQGLLVAEINGAIRAAEVRSAAEGQPVRLQRVLGFEDRKAVLSMLPETGAQPHDAKMDRDSHESRARLDVPQDPERASRPSDSPLAKFARIWSS